ncbi:hypothetical protein ACHQM5_022422 [Ranunculus cassubicifolius]
MEPDTNHFLLLKEYRRRKVYRTADGATKAFRSSELATTDQLTGREIAQSSSPTRDEEKPQNFGERTANHHPLPPIQGKTTNLERTLPSSACKNTTNRFQRLPLKAHHKSSEFQPNHLLTRSLRA